MPELSKPEWLFDRHDEWDRLASFATGAGSALAVVFGRRRQGKTTLLEALTDATGGFYWQARQQSSAQNLVSFSEAWTAWITSPDPIRFPTWDHAIRATFASGSQAPKPVVLDEFGYLVDTTPELPSLIQAHLSPRAQRSGSCRLIVCGSVFTQMASLLNANAPLRGRAQLELQVGPFDHPTSATFWGMGDNPRAAFALHALIGGTPAYRSMVGGAPRRGNVDSWAVEHVLDPRSPLFREGRIVTEEDPALGDRSLYWGVLGAIADGHRRRSSLARALGRADSALTFPLRVLAEGQWIELRRDPLHRNRSTILLTEPIVRTHRVLIEANERRLVRGQGREVWQDARATVASQIYAPHLGWLACEWLMGRSGARSIDAQPTLVGPSTFGQGANSLQLDIVAVDDTRSRSDRVVAIGEVKAGSTPIGVDQLARLDHIADRLEGPDGSQQVCRVLVARSGFTAELGRAARRRTDTVLIDLDRLYS